MSKPRGAACTLDVDLDTGASDCQRGSLRPFAQPFLDLAAMEFRDAAALITYAQRDQMFFRGMWMRAQHKRIQLFHSVISLKATIVAAMLAMVETERFRLDPFRLTSSLNS